MNDQIDFERRFQERLRARAALASRPFDAAAIARQAVGVSARSRTLGRFDWPSTHSALGWLVIALLLSIGLLGAIAAVGAFLQQRDPVPAEQMSVVRRHVDAINARDVEAFIDVFIPEATFGPGGDFRESSSVFGNSLPLADAFLVGAWMAINGAWDFEAEIIDCNQDPEAAIAFGYGQGQGEPMVVNCQVATRWPRLSMEITEQWRYEFHGSGLGHWGSRLLDLDPRARALPLGYGGLEAWEAWLAASDPDAAARQLNPREVPACDGCDAWQESLAPGDPDLAARLARLVSTAQNDWSIQGHDFAPNGLIPYDPGVAGQIEASIHEYLDSSISDQWEARP
jgi:hypothetical protein